MKRQRGRSTSEDASGSSGAPASAASLLPQHHHRGGEAPTLKDVLFLLNAETPDAQAQGAWGLLGGMAAGALPREVTLIVIDCMKDCARSRVMEDG